VRFDTQEGEVFFYLTLEPLRNSTGEVIGIIGATIDLTEQRRLEYQQKEYTARMELHYRLVNQREKELARIASTIYDGPLQDLSSIAFAVQVAKEMAQDTEVIDIIDEIKVRAQKLVDDLRSVCREIHPPSITRFGLKRAIEAHANEYQKRHPDIHVHMLLMEDYIRIPNNICLALFRIYQESLQNVALHTQATSVSILLSLEPEQFRLVIEDNGKGFLVPPDLMALVKHDHFGIVSMREYAEAVHGSLEIQSEPGIGTKVSAIIPAEEPSADFDSE
jgi:two-component system sensor histidine kinase DegS